MTEFKKNALLKSFLEKGIITVDELVCLDNKEAILKRIIQKQHKFKITSPKTENGRWTTYVTDVTKKDGRRKISKGTYEELEEYLLTFYQNGKGTELSFEFCYLEWLEYKQMFVKVQNKRHAISQSTIKRYKRDYKNYLKESSLSAMSMESMNSIKIEKELLKIIKENELKESCAKNVLGYVSMVFEYAYRNHYINENCFVHVDRDMLLSHTIPNKVKQDSERVLNREELERLKIAIRNHKESNIYYMPDYAIELALLTGMRVGEIAALKWSDIDDLYIHVDRSEHRIDYDKGYELVIDEPKNLKHRVIPVHKEIKELFQEISRLNLYSEENFIFVKQNGERYNEHTICCAIQRRGIEAGISNCSIHRIRRTVSSELRKVMDVKAVASMLGHLESTNEQHYNYDNMELNAKIRLLDDVFSNFLKKSSKTESVKAL